MHRRVQVEIEWLIALSDAGLDGFAPLSEAARGLLRGLIARFSEADARPSRTSRRPPTTT
jgi:adenylosuccinate lyase